MRGRRSRLACIGPALRLSRIEGGDAETRGAADSTSEGLGVVGRTALIRFLHAEGRARNGAAGARKKTPADGAGSSDATGHNRKSHANGNGSSAPRDDEEPTNLDEDEGGERELASGERQLRAKKKGFADLRRRPPIRAAPRHHLEAWEKRIIEDGEGRRRLIPGLERTTSSR